MTLKQIISVEVSYSFQWGNTIREAMIRPWKIPLLPLSLWKAHQIIKQYRSDSTTIIPYLFVIDYQKFTAPEKTEFQTFFNSLPECELLIIGDEFVDGAAHHFPSHRSSGKDKQQWNNDLQRLLAIIIESIRPEKFLFIGQYPYAGITGLLRTLKPKKDTAWLPLRAKREALISRSELFGHILEWPMPAKENWNLQSDCVYISKSLNEGLKSLLKKRIKENELRNGTRNQARIHFLHPNDEVDMKLEEKGILAVTFADDPANTTSVPIQHPSNHVVFYQEEEVFFIKQLDALIESVMDKRIPGPKEPLVNEKAWIDTYSSF